MTAKKLQVTSNPDNSEALKNTDWGATGTGTDGIAATGTEEISATGAEEIAATGAEEIAATGTEGIEETGSIGSSDKAPEDASDTESIGVESTEGGDNMEHTNVSPNSVHDTGGSDNAPLKVDTIPGPSMDEVEEELEATGSSELQLGIHDPFTFSNEQLASVVRIENLGGGNAFVVQKGDRLRYTDEQQINEGEYKDYSDVSMFYLVSDARPKLRITTFR